MLSLRQIFVHEELCIIILPLLLSPRKCVLLSLRKCVYLPTRRPQALFYYPQPPPPRSVLIPPPAGSVFAGKMSDIYGRKKVLLIGMVVLVISALFSALVPTFWLFICCRAVTGFTIG